MASLHGAVAATRYGAVTKAGITVVCIAVITGFITGFALRQVLTPNRVAAARLLAVDTASIGIDLIAIVTGFSAVAHVTIATTSHQTIAETGVGLQIVAVVTLLLAEMQNTVAAARSITTGKTIIAIDPIAVIALFPGIHAAVAARGTSALLIAAVVIDLVAIVAFFVSCLFGGGIQAPDAIAAL